MMSFSNTILIERPLEEVFDFLSALENGPKWNYYVQSVVKTTPDVDGIGAEYHQKRIKDKQRFVIVELIANKRLVVRTLPGTKPYLERATVFKPQEDSTLIEDSIRLNTAFPGFMEKWFAGKPQKAVAENLAKLKELLEKGATTLQDGRVVTR